MKQYELRKKIIEIRDNNLGKKLNDEDKKYVWDNCFVWHPNRDINFDDIEYIMPAINKAKYYTKAFLFMLKDGTVDFWSIDKALREVPKSLYKNLK